MKYKQANVGSTTITWAPIAKSRSSFVPLDIKNIPDSGTYTLVAEDVTNKMLRLNSAFQATRYITVPSNDDVPCPVGTSVIIASSGMGTLQLQGASGVAVRTPQSLKINRMYGRIVMIKTAINTWEIDGQLVEQVQFLMLPLDASYQLTFIKPRGEGYSDSTALANHYITFENNGYLSNNASSDGNQFVGEAVGTFGYYANTGPDGKYIRATKLSGPGVFRDQQTGAYPLIPEGVWRLWETPSASNQYGAYNPRFMTEVPISQGEGTLISHIRFDISDSPSEDGIIGSVTGTGYVPFEKIFREEFFYEPTYIGSNDTQKRIFISGSGTISEESFVAAGEEGDAYVIGNIFSKGNHPITPSDQYFVRCTLQDAPGFPASSANVSGSLGLGEIYNGYGVDGLYLDIQGSCNILVETLTDESGSVQSQTSSVLVVRAPIVLNNSFATAYVISLNSSTIVRSS